MVLRLTAGGWFSGSLLEDGSEVDDWGLILRLMAGE